MQDILKGYDVTFSNQDVSFSQDIEISAAGSNNPQLSHTFSITGTFKMTSIFDSVYRPYHVDVHNVKEITRMLLYEDFYGIAEYVKRVARRVALRRAIIRGDKNNGI